MPETSTETSIGTGRILIVDDDPLFRESIAQNLADSGYHVADFPDGPSFFDRLEDGEGADLILLDWKMPGMNGIEVLRKLRVVRPELPVIFLTVLSDQIYEEAALLGGAVDFVEKSRSFSIILKRVENILKTQKVLKSDARSDALASVVTLDALTLDVQSHRAFWRDTEVDLTLTEFGMVRLLMAQSGRDVTYRDLYDVVHGKDFQAGYGTEGYRANVRSAIKRIRQKFRDLDPDFDEIENYPGFGYRWRAR